MANTVESVHLLALLLNLSPHPNISLSFYLAFYADIMIRGFIALNCSFVKYLELIFNVSRKIKMSVPG